MRHVLSNDSDRNDHVQVVARTNDTDDLHHLGNIFGRLLVTPDLDALLKSVQ